MQVSSFDFDVITGPSAPRDGRDQPQDRGSSQQPCGNGPSSGETRGQPAAPRTR
jgi:hypothetical protein